MGKRKENEPRVYIIPKNFLDSGYVFGGRFKQRNFIEAAALTAPVFGIFLYGWKAVSYTHLDVYKRQVGYDEQQMVGGKTRLEMYRDCLLYTSRCV